MKARLSAYIEESKRGPVIVTRHGRPAAILVNAPDDPEDLERFLIAHSPIFQSIIREAVKGDAIPHDEFWAQMAARRPKRATGASGSGHRRTISRQPRRGKKGA